MNKQLFSLALWMFFGFVLIKAIDSILSFIIHAYFYFGLWMEFSLDFLNYSIPILSVLAYALTIVLVLKYVNQKAIHFEIQKTEFPKVEYIIAIIIVVFLNPLGNKLMGLMAEKISLELSFDDIEFLNLFGLTEASIAICRWITIIILSLYLYGIYKKKELEIEK
ncbi:MAG: hypothetical protein JJE55_06760 [Flavobacteriaceae bacterium]|nr:hypothetical protein [Flavobacteriaceae bacterium]